MTVRRDQRGVTIIELMIALVLGLLIVVGVSSVFLSSRQANRSSDSVGRMQETLRTSFELMARDLRETGGNICHARLGDQALPTGNVVNSVAVTSPPAWYANWLAQLVGYDGTTAFAGAAIGSAVGQRVSGTDAVSTLYVLDLGGLNIISHDEAAAVFTVGSAPGVQTGDLALVCDSRKAGIFQVGATTPTTVSHAVSAGTDGNCGSGLRAPTSCTAADVVQFAPGARIGRLVGAGWYIGNNGRAAGGGRSLYRVTRSGVEEVADGVTDMRIEYLAGNATAYAAATAIADWAAVTSIRVTLTLTSTDANVSTAAGGRLQRPLAFTVALRNRQL